MQQYLDLLRAIKTDGYQTGDRTGTGTIALPGYHYQVQLEQDEQGVIHGFPLLTTKKMSLKSVFEELIWKLRGDTNIRFLIQHNNHIWTEWPFKKWLEETGQQAVVDRMWKDEQKSDYSDQWKQKKADFEARILEDDDFCRRWGGLGKTYGFQFRHFGELTIDELINLFPEKFQERLSIQDLLGELTIDELINLLPEEFQERLSIQDLRYLSALRPGKDQLMDAIDLIKNTPESRRIIISLWNAPDLGKTLLPPCPAFYQFFANQEGYLHLNLYQRSCDSFLGVPYNTAQDALFLCMMAHVTGRKPGVFNHFFGDAHIYLNHLDQVDQQLQRTPRQLPSLKLNPEITDILDFRWEDIELFNYAPQGHIKGAVSI